MALCTLLHNSANECVFKGVCESNQGNNGHLNQEQQCRNNTPFHTPEGESISATFDSSPYQPAHELQASTVSPSSQPLYDGLPSQSVSKGRKEWERERGRGRWVGKVSRYRDIVIRGEHWVKELWFDGDLGWIGDGKRFSRGQGIQFWLDSMVRPPHTPPPSLNTSSLRGFQSRPHWSINIIITHLSPQPLDGE